MDPIGLFFSALCTGLCCLSATALAVGGAILFLRKKPSELDESASPELVEQPRPAVSTPAAPQKPPEPARQPRPIGDASAPAEGKPPGLSLGGAFDGDLFDDEEMATVVAPPPQAISKDIPAALPPPPPGGAQPPPPPGDPAKPRGTPAPPPPRSSGQTIIAFDDDDEDW